MHLYRVEVDKVAEEVPSAAQLIAVLGSQLPSEVLLFCCSTIAGGSTQSVHCTLHTSNAMRNRCCLRR